MRTPEKSRQSGVPRPEERLSYRAGFTLVEAMVGAAILGVTMAALYGAFSFGFTTIKLSQEDVRADQILVQKLETLRVYNWTQVTNGSLVTNFTAYYSSGATNGLSYSGLLSVTPFIPSASNESYSNTLRQVTASVSWPSGKVTRTRTMTTLFSTNGLWTFKL
jgi:prepilin-type N-terminal cleavage/methylation domain-containing protein